MHIPEEVLERATRRVVVSVNGQSFAHIHTDPEVIAEWARKEALREAADAVAAADVVMAIGWDNVPVDPYPFEDIIRALMEVSD